MSKYSDTEPIPLDCEAKVVCSVTERKYTIGMILRRIIKVVMCAIILLLTFWIGDFRGWERREALIQRNGVYVYDTQRKLDTHYQNQEKAFLDTGLPSELTRDAIDSMRSMRPLVVAGPVVVFLDDHSGSYEVYKGNIDQPIATYDKTHEKHDRQYLYCKVEKGWEISRFTCGFTYSKDGIYENGLIAISGKDGLPVRIYRDTMGHGVFDEMRIYENDIEGLYHLNGLTWEKVDEQPFNDDQEMDVEQLDSPENKEH